MAERNNSISMAKGIAIILMVLAHAIFSGYLRNCINMFHMSLFFFASGYCFKESHLSDFKIFALKRIKGLYLPYIKYSLIFLICHNIFFHINIYNDMYGFAGRVSRIYSIDDFFIRAFHIVTRMFDHEQLLGGYWFLHTLLCASFLAYFCIRFSKKHFIPIVTLLFLSLFASCFNFHVPIVGIGVMELVATLTFYVAFLIKKINLLKKINFWIIPISIFAVAVGAFYWQAEYMTLHHLKLKLVPWILSALLGTIGCIKLCVFIERFSIISKFLCYVGNNTLPILTWHFLCFKIMSLFIIIYHGLPIQRLAEFPVIVEYKDIYWGGVLDCRNSCSFNNKRLVMQGEYMA